MPSNNSGGPKNPWADGTGSVSGSCSAPDLDDLMRQGRDRLKKMMLGGGPRGMIIRVILALLGLAAWSAFYTVPSDSVAVVQRFGQYLKEVLPGLHFRGPLGVDTVCTPSA